MLILRLLRNVLVNETSTFMQYSHRILTLLTFTGKLPLHFAAGNANISFECLKFLLDAYPRAAAIKSNKGILVKYIYVFTFMQHSILILSSLTNTGKLPLHFASGNTNISFECLKLLFEANPEAATMMDDYGK